MTDKDYSGTPLWRKLGIAEGARVLFVAPPTAFETELDAIAPMPGVERLTRRGRDLDVVVLFVTDHSELERRAGELASSLSTAGRLWVAWPKRASKVGTDLSFEIVQRHGLDLGLVDNKSASITGVFQGVQFVRPLRDR